MRIIVPLKLVPDLVEDLEVDNTGKALDEEFLTLKLNEFDDHALEEALLLKEEGIATEIVVIAVDNEEVDRVLYTALAKGADKAIVIKGTRPADSHQLARAFVNAIDNLSFDLILTGVQSANDRDGQLGPILATYMNLPCVSVVNGLEVTGNTVTVRKEYSGGMLGEFEVDLPAVLGIQAARKIPRYTPVSKIRQVQETMSFLEVSAGDLGPGSGTEINRLASPETGAGAEILDSVKDLVEILRG